MLTNLFLLQSQPWFETYILGNTAIANIIILIILFLLGASVWMFLQHRSRITLEQANLVQLKSNLFDWKERTTNYDELDNDFVEDNKDEDEDIVTVYEASIENDLMPHITQNTIVFERLRVLQELRTTKSRVSIGVLQQMSEVQDAQFVSSRLPTYIMSLSMLLGMLGTFIGLTLMVGEMTQQLTAMDSAMGGSDPDAETLYASFAGIQNIMRGVGTAFTTTLAGLTCTIIVSALSFFQRSKKLAFFDSFEQFTVKELLPNTFPDLEQEEVINAIKEQLRETFENLNKTIDKNSKTLGNIDGLYEKFDSIIDTVKSVLATGGTGELQGVLSQVLAVNDNLEKIIDKYENRKLLGDFQQVAEKYDGYLKKHDFILEQSKWLPNARVFMIAIAALLAIIALFLGVGVFSS